MNYCLKGFIALGVVGTLVYAEVQGEGHPHAQYMAGSTSNNLVASGGYVSNVSASTVTYTHQPSPVNLEFLLPHDRLVIQDKPLTPPTVKLARSTPASGANPFFQRRQRAAHLKAQSAKAPAFWCNSFQKFRSRMVT
jgi:hypothetical protein